MYISLKIKKKEIAQSGRNYKLKKIWVPFSETEKRFKYLRNLKKKSY